MWKQKEIKGFTSVEMLTLFWALEYVNRLPKGAALFGVDCRDRRNCVNWYLTIDMSAGDDDDVTLVNRGKFHDHR